MLLLALVVTVAVGCGAQSDVVPALRGEPSTTARQALDRLDVKVNQREAWSDQVPRGRVLSSSPPSGAPAPRQGATTLVVSKGAPPGPYGTLGTSSVGPVQIGMRPAEVEDRFGAPAEEEPVNYGAGPTPQVDWRWQAPDGVFVLSFDRETATVAGYCTTSPAFTALGLRAGQVTGSAVVKIASRQEMEPTLAYDPRVEGERRNVLISEDEPGTYPGLRFNADDDGTVVEICGGQPPPAGE